MIFLDQFEDYEEKNSITKQKLMFFFTRIITTTTQSCPNLQRIVTSKISTTLFQNPCLLKTKRICTAFRVSAKLEDDIGKNL